MVAKRVYVPDSGDVVWLNFNPTRGHEQSGERPALVLSAKIYNARSGLLLACPITSQNKGYPFEVEITGRKMTGVVLADQVRTFDWKARKVCKISAAPASVVAETKEYIRKILTL